MPCKKKAAQGISTDRATHRLGQTRIVPISELKVPHPRKPLTRRPTNIEIRGCLPNGEKFMRRHPRGSSCRLHAGPYRKRASPAGPRGNEGDKHLHTQTRVHRQSKREVGKWEEETQGSEEQRGEGGDKRCGSSR